MVAMCKTIESMPSSASVFAATSAVWLSEPVEMIATWGFS
jgi:hypothetical protein